MRNTYRKPMFQSWNIGGVEKLEGETIEQKIDRVVNNNEPIEDGAPEIFTDRKEGVNAAYNIRTDRWEVAADAMHLVHTSKKDELQSIAMRENKPVDKTGTDGQNGSDGSTESGA